MLSKDRSANDGGSWSFVSTGAGKGSRRDSAATWILLWSSGRSPSCVFPKAVYEYWDALLSGGTEQPVCFVL